MVGTKNKKNVGGKATTVQGRQRLLLYIVAAQLRHSTERPKQKRAVHRRQWQRELNTLTVTSIVGLTVRPSQR